MSLTHHQLCFGCGQTNVFGLLLEAERVDDRSLTGRWFVKQDHQGPVRGSAHPGIVACALIEAIMLAKDEGSELRGVQFELDPGAELPVGSFCEVEVRLEADPRSAVGATATASADGRLVGTASATLECVRGG